jgi:hypothetical protein
MPPITDTAAEESAESTATKSAEGEHCVPVAALALDGTAPAEGDDVTYTVKGTVTRIEGDCAYVKPSSINDEPVKEKEVAEEPSAMDAAMQADAAQMES